MAKIVEEPFKYNDWKCDRCGERLEKPKDLNYISVDSLFGNRKYYLCEDCFGWFAAFMDGGSMSLEPGGVAARGEN